MDTFGAAAIRAVTVRQINEQNSKVFVRMADRFHNGFLGLWMAVQPRRLATQQVTTPSRFQHFLGCKYFNEKDIAFAIEQNHSW